MTIDINQFISFYKNKIGNQPKIIFEIGSREADDSIKFKKEFPNAEVYAFEAHPECFNKHIENVLKNNVKYYNIPMWNTEENLVFYDKNIESGISSFRNRGDLYGTNTIILKTSTPFLFCNENNIKNIDILKIDVEGCTYEVLDGFGDMIENINFIHIETEEKEHFLGQYIESVVFDFLNKKNFKLLKHSWCCLNQFDSIWINKKLNKNQELKHMLDFWKEQHKDDQYFDCKDNYKDDLLDKYNHGNDAALISMGLMDGLWGSDLNSTQAFFDITKHGKGIRVLEIGCGYGGFGTFIAKYVNQYDGVDISENIVNNGNRGIKDAEIKNMKLYCAEDCDLSFLEDKSYDIIFSTAVFIHTEEDVTQHYLKETARLLKDDGFFIHHLNITNDCTINDFYNKIYNIDECNDLFINNNLKIISNRDGIYFKNNCFMRYYIGNGL